MNNDLKQRVPIPKNARIRPYYDTQPIEQNNAVVNFFPPSGTKDVTRDNYISNSFPGNDTRRIAGLSFELVRQYLRDDAANGIDAAAIINAVKHAGVILTADQNYQQFLRTTIEEQSNFAQTEFEGALASAYVNAGYVTEERKTAILKSADMYRLEDPFDIAPNQNVNLEVQFNDASPFPTEQQWTDSGQPKLWLRATLYLAEIKSDN